MKRTFLCAVVTAATMLNAQTRTATETYVQRKIDEATAGQLTKKDADAAYYPKAQGDAWSAYWDGDEVRVTVTNYDSRVHMPQLYMEQRNDELSDDTNEFRVVWHEMTRWNWFLDIFGIYTNTVGRALNNKADRAWGFYDSHTGEYAPDGYTSVSSCGILISKGMTYQRTVTTDAEVWILTATEPYEVTGIASNGFFKITDGSGATQFEIVKGDKVTVKAQANSVTVLAGNPQPLQVVYNVTAADPPKGEMCLALESANWKKESDADCPATVVWTGESGAYVATITPKVGTSRLFFKATYEKGGETYINNVAPVAMRYIMIGGTRYRIGTATIDGHTVLTLTK